MSGKRVARNRPRRTPTPVETQGAFVKAARTWHDGIDTEAHGIDLGLCMEYKMLEVMITNTRSRQRELEQVEAGEASNG